MKKRAVGILVGVMVSSMLLSACGSNEAKEAASESAQVEEEGTGERTEEGEKVENLVLTIFSVRLEDDPYKTQVKGTTPYFYVRQILKLKDASGNLVTFRISSRTASRHSCQLPAMEHAYRIDETVHMDTT